MELSYSNTVAFLATFDGESVQKKCQKLHMTSNKCPILKNVSV